MKHIFYLIAIALLLISCSKDEPEQILEEEILEEEIADDITISFTITLPS